MCLRRSGLDFLEAPHRIAVKPSYVVFGKALFPLWNWAERSGEKETMPELPEVEHTARQLREAIIGATIHETLVFWERTIGHPELPDFQAEVADREILSVRRRGKFLILDLSGELILTIHRRMTGNLLLLSPGWEIDTSLKTI